MSPSPAGDVFFATPSPYARGHLEAAYYLMFDYANRPVRLSGGSGDGSVVAGQGFMRLDASMAFFDRLLVSLDVPLAVVQSGGDPQLAGITFATLEAPAFGDVSVGARLRAMGDDGGPLQVGIGSRLFLPTGDPEQYTGEGAVRGAFHGIVGGTMGDDVGFVYSLKAGTELRAGTRPHALTYGAGVGLLLADNAVQLDAELFGMTALGDTMVLASTPQIEAGAGTNAELLFGGKLRLFDGLMLGTAAGPGLGSIVGTPTFRALATVGWIGLPARAAARPVEQADARRDRDDDGIRDLEDACPDDAGQPSDDPKKDGCPAADRDGDGVLDVDDACPTIVGVRSADATENGCPADGDGDGYHDGIDACPKLAGGPSADPSKVGCPADDDGDSINNRQDSCPTVPGDPHDDPEKNGCPADPDGDGIRYGADACPSDRGVASSDPKKHGCPAFVRVSEGEILISQRIEFDTASVSPDSLKVLQEVAQAIKDHPEILLLEVQGHTDDDGDEKFNLELSQQRADVVRRWLSSEGGVDPALLVAKGYGFNRPLADNRIRTGRTKNRRVQFVILKRVAAPKKTPAKRAQPGR